MNGDCQGFDAWQGPPATGRIVHYMSRGSADGRFAPRCRAAIITDVPDLLSEQPNSGPDGYVPAVDITVVNPTGFFFDREIPYDPEGGPGSWHWGERK